VPKATIKKSPTSDLPYLRHYVELSDGTTVAVGEETELTNEQLKELDEMKGVTVSKSTGGGS